MSSKIGESPTLGPTGVDVPAGGVAGLVAVATGVVGVGEAAEVGVTGVAVAVGLAVADGLDVADGDGVDVSMVATAVGAS